MTSLVEVRIGGRFRLNNILGKGLFSEVFEGKALLRKARMWLAESEWPLNSRMSRLGILR